MSCDLVKCCPSRGLLSSMVEGSIALAVTGLDAGIAWLFLGQAGDYLQGLRLTYARQLVPGRGASRQEQASVTPLGLQSGCTSGTVEDIINRNAGQGGLHPLAACRWRPWPAEALFLTVASITGLPCQGFV